MKLFYIYICIFLLISWSTLAQEDYEGLGRTISACDKWEDAKDRLACFERALSAFKSQAHGTLESGADSAADESHLNSDVPDVLPRWEELPPSLQKRYAPEEANETSPDEIVVTRIQSTNLGISGARTFVMENGQIWRERSNSTLIPGTFEGREVTISPSMLGGWRLKVKGVRGRAAVEYVE